MVTKSELEAFLKENPPANKFVPYCYLDRASDSLTVYFEADPDHSVRLTDHITLFISLETDEIVGCRIKGITGILEDLPNFIRINHGDVKLSLVFLTFLGGADEAVRSKIKGLAQEASDRDLIVGA